MYDGKQMNDSRGKQLMRKLFLFTGLSLILMLAACSSAESKEILEYHNAFVENVSDKMVALDQPYDHLENAATDKQALDIFDSEILPAINEMKEYMDGQKLETEVAKEYHNMRLEWLNAWSEGNYMEKDALENYVNNSLTEDEMDKLMQQAESKYKKAQELDQKANEKIDELADEYNFEEEE